MDLKFHCNSGKRHFSVNQFPPKKTYITVKYAYSITFCSFCFPTMSPFLVRLVGAKTISSLQQTSLFNGLSDFRQFLSRISRFLCLFVFKWQTRWLLECSPPTKCVPRLSLSLSIELYIPPSTENQKFSSFIFNVAKCPHKMCFFWAQLLSSLTIIKIKNKKHQPLRFPSTLMIYNEWYH